MDVEILKTLKIESDKNENDIQKLIKRGRVSIDDSYSAYFKYGYPSQDDNKIFTTDDYLKIFFEKYRDYIKRIHLPPERNLKHLDETTNLLRVLELSLKSAGYHNKIYVDLHSGHSIGMKDAKNYAMYLNKHLKKYDILKASIENIKGSAISSIEDIVDFAKYIQKQNLDNIKITIDVSDLEKVEGNKMSFYKLIEELKEENLLDTISAVHADKEWAKTIKNNFRKVLDNIQIVIENSE